MPEKQPKLAPFIPARHCGKISSSPRGERAMTADTALRLARFFGATPRFWVHSKGYRRVALGIVSNSPSSLSVITFRSRASRRMDSISGDVTGALA